MFWIAYSDRVRRTPKLRIRSLSIRKGYRPAFAFRAFDLRALAFLAVSGFT